MAAGKDGDDVPWDEIKIAAIGLGASCAVTVIVSIIGYRIAARRRTLGQSVVTWFGNLFVIAVLSIVVPAAVCAIWGPEGFFGSIAGWVALIAAMVAGYFINWYIAAVIGMIGVAGQGMAGIMADDYDPGPDPNARSAEKLFVEGEARRIEGEAFADADPASASVIAGKWDLIEFKANSGKVEDALDMVERLIGAGGDPQRRRLAELVDAGKLPALADNPRTRELLGTDAFGD